MPDVVPAPHGSESQDDESRHGGPEDQPQDEEKRAVQGREVVEDCHPQAGQGGKQAGGGKDASGNLVPAGPAALAPAKRGYELKRPQQQLDGDGGDVDQHGDRRVEEARVVRRRLTRG